MKETIQSDLKEALKRGQQDKVEALRLLISAIKNAEIQNNKESLTESEVLDIINKQIKQYREAIQQLAEAGRKEPAEVELAKMAYLKAYLPSQLSDEEINIIISETILSLKASGLSGQGPVIREVQKKVSGRADNVKVAQLVREQLQKL